MSNLIRSHKVKYEVGPIRTITSKAKIDDNEETNQTNKDGFEEGIDVLSVSTETSEEEIEEKSAHLLEMARRKADLIIEQAKADTEILRKEAYEEGKSQGYDEGVKNAKDELAQKKEELYIQESNLKKEYNDLVKDLEPTMVRIISELIQKITGVVVKDKEEIILHLIGKAFEGMGKSDEYIIRVSNEDYQYVNSKKDLLIAAIEDGATLTILQDSSLTKNQCIIEENQKAIDSSLDVQLENLITDLRLLISL